MFSVLRRVRAAVVVAAVSVVLIASLATPAYAAQWLFGEDFENHPEATWWFEQGAGASSGVFANTDGFAHSGEYYALMQMSEPGWISVDHAVRLPVSLTKRCTARAWILALPPDQQAVVGIEIINPATWTYVANGTFTLLPPYPIWEQRSISWTGGPTNVVIRIVLAGQGVWTKIKVDDVGITCTY